MNGAPDVMRYRREAGPPPLAKDDKVGVVISRPHLKRWSCLRWGTRRVGLRS